MKKIWLLLPVLFLISCSPMKDAQSYHAGRCGGEDVGKITYILEKEGYSIITFEDCTYPVYIKGRVDFSEPFQSAKIFEDKNMKGETLNTYLIYRGRKYKLDLDPSRS